jgi:hypothetical protein
MMAQALAPTGALMAMLALWTGAFWGRPTWGTYWAWDARMTSTLILLFLYLGVIALRNAIEDPRRADRACALLALVGAVNVPIIYFSVQWWNTLHQGSSISLTFAPKMAMTMVAGILIMTAAAWCYTIAVTLARVQAIIVERERGATWLDSLIDLRPRTGGGGNVQAGDFSRWAAMRGTSDVLRRGGLRGDRRGRCSARATRRVLTSCGCRARQPQHRQPAREASGESASSTICVDRRGLPHWVSPSRWC